jgi:hypothetical protein
MLWNYKAHDRRLKSLKSSAYKFNVSRLISVHVAMTYFTTMLSRQPRSKDIQLHVLDFT